MDRLYLITDSEEMARSISGKIETLSSFGSFIRFDAISLGLSPRQKKPSVLVPSQEINPPDGKNRKKRDSTSR